MKRLGSSDSLGGLMSICPNSTEKYARDLQAMMDGYEEENDCMVEQEACHVEKKRRLSVDQVRALEKNFEVENKLEPERKVKLAQELGLQPRQVAVWFQNRRARWKTKQLERDYGLLKATFDGLKANFDKLQHDNEALVKEIRELKSKINEDGNVNSESKLSVKDDELMSDTDQNTKLENPIPKPVKIPSSENTIDSGNNANRAVFRDHFKDGSSDSDSSAILNDDNNHSSPNHGIINEFLDIHPNINLNNNNNFQFQESSKVTGVGKNVSDDCQQQQQQYVKIEEHNFFGEESCSTFFSDDQAPSLHWYEWS